MSDRNNVRRGGGRGRELRVPHKCDAVCPIQVRGITRRSPTDTLKQPIFTSFRGRSFVSRDVYIDFTMDRYPWRADSITTTAARHDSNIGPFWSDGLRRGPRNARRERVRGVTGAGTGPEPLETGIVPHGPVHDSRCRLAARRALLSVKCQRNVTAGNPVQWISKPLNVQHDWENARPSQMVVPTVEIGRLVHVTVLRSARHVVKFTRNSQTQHTRLACAPGKRCA